MSAAEPAVLAPYLDDVPAIVVERLRGARRVLAVSHENPDADTLGATLGVVAVVEALGGTADAVCTDPVPALYRFIAGVERFRTDPDPAATYDLVVISDCGSLDRVGEVGVRHADLFARLPRVVIDHHASNDSSGEADWIEPHAAATCEMVALLAARLGVPFRTGEGDAAGAGDGRLADALMAGIVMDTATFAHPNATPRTLAVAAALVAAGAPLSDISRRLYRSKPTAQLQLFGRVLDRLASSADGRVVWSTMLIADLAASGTVSSHSEGIIDLLAQADEAEVAILFKEAEEGSATRVSVRTKPGGVDATVLTGAFGGGGHARAAGASVPLPVDQARPPVLAEATRLAAAVTR
jgi:phosphoesterase RecJ-like protein